MSKTAAALSGDAPDAPVRPRLGRRIGLIAYSVFVGVVVLALIAAGVGVWFVNRSFPQTEGTIALDGLSGAVTVQRSELGIPTITASSTDDLFFAQGYVHAQDRFWEMDFRRHVTSGRLAELFGESQLGTDAFLRTLGWREIAEQEVAALDETTLSYYQSYADGVNAYLVDRDKADISLEYAVLGLQNAHYEIEPWTPADSVAWLKAMAWDLRSNIETETERALLATTYTDEQVLELYPPYPFDENPVIVPEITDVPAATETADAATAGIRWTEVADVVSAVSTLIGGTGEGIGSNSWVVAGDYTDTGMPLLANDPHLGASLPSVWYQAGLRCSVVSDTCPFDVSGFSFSGVPGIIIGHNASIAWGFTNLTTDVVDLYIEKLDGDRYWRDGQLVDLFANVVWDELAQNLFTRGRSTPVPLTSQSRQFLVVQNLLADPGSPWWTNTEIGVSGQRDMLEASARSATEILTTAQGSNPLQWRWGTLHAITLTHETFGTSGIAPIEALFNRGPFPVGGGSSVVNATGWPLGEGFATTTVPSMRMVVDLSHFDASGWNHLTGASGHAFHENYTDQTATWQAAGLIPWAFTRDAVTAATEHTLTLEPAN